MPNSTQTLIILSSLYLNKHINTCLRYQPRLKFLQASKQVTQASKSLALERVITESCNLLTSPGSSRCSATRNGSTSDAAVSATSAACPWAAHTRSSSGGGSARAPRGRSRADAESVVDPDLGPKPNPAPSQHRDSGKFEFSERTDELGAGTHWWRWKAWQRIFTAFGSWKRRRRRGG